MLQIDSVSKLYKGGDKALDNISFSVEQGEFISVIGKSGAGKTTLFRLLNGMIKPTAGRIIINNQDFTKLKGRKKRDIQKTIGTIYQDFCLVDTITCLDNVLNGALADRNAFQALFGIFTKEQKEYARKQLEAVGLSEKMYSYAGKLSGGQKQRVAIARALMQKPDIILADEPVASLDPYSAEQITDILVQLNRQYNITVIMNSHSVELALKKSDRIIGIADGRLVLDKKSSEVTDENIEFIYGGAYEKHEQNEGYQKNYGTGNAFYNNIRDMIDYNTIATGDKAMEQYGHKEVRQRDNIAEAKVHGINVSANAYLGAGFNLSGGYTHLNTQDVELEQPIDKSIKNAYNINAQWAHSWKIYRLNINLNGRFNSKRFSKSYGYAPEYQLWDLNTRHSFNLKSVIIEPGCGMENLFDYMDDRPYNSNYATLTPGRSFYISLSLKFKS